MSGDNNQENNFVEGQQALFDEYDNAIKGNKRPTSDEWMSGYWAKKAEEDRLREEKNTRAQRLGTILSDLGASIGDIIQASGGAAVLPRDVQKNYDALNEREKDIYNTYWARMDAIRKEQESKDEKDRERALDAAKMKLEASLNDNRLLYKIQKDEEEAKRNRAHNAQMNREKNEAYRQQQQDRIREQNGWANFDFGDGDIVTFSNNVDAAAKYRAVFTQMLELGIIPEEELPDDNKRGLNFNDRQIADYVNRHINQAMNNAVAKTKLRQILVGDGKRYDYPIDTTTTRTEYTGLNVVLNDPWGWKQKTGITDTNTSQTSTTNWSNQFKKNK